MTVDNPIISRHKEAIRVLGPVLDENKANKEIVVIVYFLLFRSRSLQKRFLLQHDRIRVHQMRKGPQVLRVKQGICDSVDTLDHDLDKLVAYSFLLLRDGSPLDRIDKLVRGARHMWVSFTQGQPSCTNGIATQEFEDFRRGESSKRCECKVGYHCVTLQNLKFFEANQQSFSQFQRVVLINPCPDAEAVQREICLFP